MMTRPNIREALAGGLTTAAWCRSHDIDVYVHLTQRFLGTPKLQPVLDVTNITNQKPGSGKLGCVFNEAERAARDHGLVGVFVENVLNERLADWLERRGYELVEGSHILPCYLRKLQDGP